MNPGAAKPAARGRSRIVEVKRALDGSERRYDCALVAASSTWVVILFRFVRDGRAIDSYGLFWPRRSYNCYYAVPAGGGAPVFVRFDVVRDVDIDLRAQPPEARYTDLLLDLWVDAAGPRWEDEDDVLAASAAGGLTPDDVGRIEATRALLNRRHRRIAAEVRALLRGLGVRT